MRKILVVYQADGREHPATLTRDFRGRHDLRYILDQTGALKILGWEQDGLKGETIFAPGMWALAIASETLETPA